MGSLKCAAFRVYAIWGGGKAAEVAEVTDAALITRHTWNQHIVIFEAV